MFWRNLLFRCDRKIYLTWHSMLSSHYNQCLRICWTVTYWMSQLLSLVSSLSLWCQISASSCRWCFWEALFLLLEVLISLTDGKDSYWDTKNLPAMDCHTNFCTSRRVSFHSSSLQLSGTWIGREVIKYLSPSPQHHMVRCCCHRTAQRYRNTPAWAMGDTWALLIQKEIS